MDALLQDLKFALRALARTPAFTLVAVATLALGIGAATAVFSVANGVLLRPLPYAEPDEIATVWASWDNFPDKTWLSVPEYQLFHQESRAFSDLALYRTSSASFTAVDAPEEVGAAFITPNLLEVLGVTPALGRSFTWEEARGGTAGILLSHEVWQRRYGGDSTVVGTSAEIGGLSVPVLGVLPEGFALPLDLARTSRAGVFYAYYVDLDSPAADLGGGGSHGSYGVGRLRAGMGVDEARADLARVMAQVEPVGLYSPVRRFSPRVFAAEADVVGSARATILVLLGAVGLLLLIACGNVANLLLTRSEARTSEVAVRAALGAGSARIARLLVTESLVLSLAAGLLGLALASAGVEAMLAIDPAAVPRASEVRVDASVVLFTLAAVVATTLLFGLVPALRVARAGVQRGLKRAGRGALGGPGSSRSRGALVASQMAMAVVLLTASGLMMRSFVRLLGVDAGFVAGDVLTLRVTAPQATYPDAPAVARFYRTLLERIEAVPGVRAAAAVRLLPLVSTMGDSFFRPVDYEARPDESTQGEWQWATPGYFEVMHIPLLEGRTFTEGDDADGQAVVVVNAAMARRYWGAESALGRRVLASGSVDTALVAGVVGDVRHNGLAADAKPQYYVPLAQVEGSWAATMRSMTLTVATEGPPQAYLDALRAEVRALDPSLAVAQVMTLDEALARSVAGPRFALVLLAAFAACALVLAAVGIYGVLSYVVSRRTREIGIRAALGAEPGQMVGMIVRQGFVMATLGVAAGSIVAWLLADVMAGLLYGVAPQDPATFASAPVLLLSVALLACWIPAARAARVGPASALRSE
jgi:predicted permease